MKKPLKDQAYAKIKSMILKNEFSSDNAITELGLSSTLGIGRAPIREALNLLAKDGLIQLFPNKGAILKRWDPIDLIKIYEVRQVLDPLAAKLAIARIDIELLQKIEQSIQNMDSDWATGMQLSHDLHDLIYRSCGNTYLWEVYNSLSLKIEVSRFFLWNMYSATSDRKAVEKRKKEHIAILNAVRDKDTKLAEKLSRKHISNVIAEVKKWL